MSQEAIKGLFDGMKGIRDAVLEIAPGLKDLVPDAKAELSRLGTQGSMELASALFGGNAFVPYGPGQYTATPEYGHAHGHEQEQEQERGGMER